MKKYLLPCLFLLMPFALAAQDAMALYPDFYDGVKSAVAFVWNDQVNIIEVNTDNDNFDVAAVNDQLQFVWRSSFAGDVIKTARFGNKIVAIATTQSPTFKGAGNTYKAYLIDPANGKLLLEKEFYHGSDDYMEIPAVFNGDGGYVKLFVRQTTFERRNRGGIAGMLGIVSAGSNSGEVNESRELDIISLNDKLETTSTVKLPVTGGNVINWCANKQADVFIARFNGPAIEVDKYADGSSSPVKQLTADVSFESSGRIVLSESLYLLPSAADSNVLYYGTTYINQDNEAEPGVGKLDFSTGKKLFVTEAFSREHVKALEKSFVPANKKADDVNLGARSGLHIRYLGEAGGTLIATVTSQHFQSSSIGSGTWCAENSILVNGYDENLNTRFQQILPANSGYPNRFLPIGYYAAKDKFYVLGNEKSGINTETGIYGCLDLASGKWEKMEALSKKHISNSDYTNGNSAMWFANSFVAPYFKPKGLSQNNFDITLQQNGY